MAIRNERVRVWRVQDRRGAKGYGNRPWLVRWQVDGSEYQETHRTRSEADNFRARLLVAQQDGQQFDPVKGRPESWLSGGGDIRVHDWVRRFINEQWDEWQPRTRNSAIEELSRLIPLLIRPAAPGRPELRVYLTKALRPDYEPEPDLEQWMDKWSYTLDDLNRSILADVDQQLGYGLEGQMLAPGTATRYRRTARTCIGRAVDLELIDRNPWPPAQRGAKNRKARRKDTSVDVKRLPDPATAAAALDAMITHQPASRMYRALTATMIYGGLRPSEAVMLRPRALHLPESGWGKIEVVEADIDFDESGDPKTGNRTVPIPPVLVEILSEYLAGNVNPNAHMFRTRNDNRPLASNWRRSWQAALARIGHERLRLYDCRHTAATTWLSAGVPLGEAARRMGHSVETLVTTYVGALVGDEEASNDMIDIYFALARKKDG
ncbi:MAG: tyrosine-type recombinase/integrase [Acidimicrobiales bacterium]